MTAREELVRERDILAGLGDVLGAKQVSARIEQLDREVASSYYAAAVTLPEEEQ